jgi:nucleoside-diphosphate-sugar epimerase
MQPCPLPSSTASLPATIRDVEELEDLLSQPSAALCADLASLPGDIAVVGIGGKVGPTLARMLRRAAPEKRIYGIARFSDPEVKQRLESWGVICVPCDLTDRSQVAALPDAAQVIFMAGRKFGTGADAAMTWMMNTVVPAYVCERYRGSRIVGFSTLCVYPFAEVAGPGSSESTPTTPIGEYPNSCVGRERVIQHFSYTTATPARVCRLNYAIDLRYGVLHDIGRRVLQGEPIDLRTGVANVIWQRDSTDWIVRCLAHTEIGAPPINIGAAQPARVRDVALAFGRLFGREPHFSGSEEAQAWHNDCSLAAKLFGTPSVDLDTMIRWNADWLQRQAPVYSKPTHYAERQGAF